MKKSKWRRLVSLLLVLSVVASLVLAAVPGVSARATGVQGTTAIHSADEGWLCDGVYEIYSVANMQYAWDINGASIKDGGNLTVYPANHGGAQRFVVQRLNDDAFHSIRNLNSNKYLDLEDSGRTNVQQFGNAVDNVENRRWVICYAGKVTINGETYETFAIKSKLTGKYVTVAGNNIYNEANIVATATDTNSMYTRWIFKPVNVKSGEFYLRSKITKDGKTFSVDIPGGASGNTVIVDGKEVNVNVQLWSANTSNAQRFTITPTKDGYATITAFCSGRFVCSEYAGTVEGTNLIQYGSYNEGSFSANTKWAVIPNTDGSYSFCNYDNGLYLDLEMGDAVDGKNIKCWINNGGDAQRWNLVSLTYAKGDRGNAQTGVVPESFNPKDVIRLPIEIYDYKADGMLFEYAESPTGPNNSEIPGNNRGFGMLRSSNYSNNNNYWNEATPSLYYKTTHTGYCPEAPNVLKYVGKVYNNYGSGASNLDSTYPGAYDNITYVSTYQTNGAAIDYTGVISEKLGYTLYNRLTDGIATVGLVQPTLDSATGNPVYTPQAVEYIAHLLYTTLKITENRKGYDCYNYVDGEKRLEYNANGGETLAIALRYQLTLNNGKDYTNKDCYQLGDYKDTMTRAANLKGSFRDVRNNILTCFDAAYYLLNNLFDEKGYHLYGGDLDGTTDIAPYDYLELTSVTTASGKQGYIFDAAFTNTTNVGSAASAVQYQDRVIRNTSANAKTQYCYSGDGSGYLTSMYPFLPVTGMNNSSGQTVSPNRADDGTTSTDDLGATYKNRDYNYVLKSSGEFVYNADDNLFFDFEGDDDVYLFINGQLVLDIGGAHSITKVEMNLNDYVRAARAKVAAGTATDRDRALALVDGQTYDFDFFYMERHGYGANMRVFTNIKVTDKSTKTVKTAYQNGEALNEGATVVEGVPIEYSFSLTNQSAYDLTKLTFDDHDLAVSIRYDTGLTVNDTENITDANGETLDASDVIIQYTNQSGYTATKTFESNDALKAYLTNLKLKPKETLTVRGVWLQSITPKLSGNKFLNTVHTSAQTESGSPIYGSDDMWLFIPAEPSYYEWAGHDLSIAATKIITDVKKAAEEAEDKENHPLYGRTNGLTTSNFSKIEVCTAGGTVISSNNLKISGSGTSSALVVNYPKVGSYTAYVKVTYGSNTNKDNATLVLPVQIYVTNVQDSVFVLDYGLKADLGEVMKKTDNLTVPGRSTNYLYEGFATAQPSYVNNHISFTPAADNDVDYKLSAGKDTIEYQPSDFMEGADSVYAAVRVYEGTASDAIGTVNINTEVEMYKQITVLPANVVYYEDDFPAIKYYGNNDGNTKNTFTTDGTGSGSLYQSADQSTQYGFDDTYGTGTTMSGNSGHVIEIKDSKVAAEFTFVGTGFELIGRSTASDNGVIYLDVINSAGTRVKRIPVILEYEDTNVTTGTEGIYQVPIVRVDDLKHGKYTVQIHGVPTTAGTKRILFIDGVRIYNPLAKDDTNRNDYYIDGEDTAEFLEIRNLILSGKAAVVSFEENETTGALKLTTNTSTYTENRNGVTYPVNTFKLKSVQYGGYFVDAETKTGATDYPPINLRTDATVLGNNQFVFTFAKTENNTDYYYIHIYSGGHERYLKRSAVNGNANIMLVSKQDQNPATKDPDCFLWKITSLDKAQGIVTIQNKHDSSYLSVATVNASAKTGTIQAVSIGTITDAQKWELGAIASQTVFKGNVVESVNDYLVFGPNNELYLDGENQKQALAFYFTPDGNTTTTTMLQVGVHVLNDQRLQGVSGDLTTQGMLYQSAYTDGITGWKTLDENIQTSTEGYYPIDLSLCKYDATLNRYEVVLYCGGGYLSFTNLKVSGGTIETITGETADLRYNNGVLELLTTVGAANTRTWVPVSNPENYPDFASLTKQMSSTTMFELDADTGEFVPVLIESEAKVALAGRSLLFKDIIKMRFYFDISATGVTTATPENSGLLIWTEEEYAAFDSHTVDNAGKKLRGLTYSVNGYYADTQGIPAKNMVDKLYVRAYVILPDGSYEYSDITEFSPVMYAQIILDKETSSETMKELVIALMNYGAAAQKRFNYKTDELMNAWLPAEQQTAAWSDEWINALPTDTSKFTFDANEQITMVGSSVTFVGAVNQNFYFDIPAELTQNAAKIELLYWTESEYEEMTELTVANAHRVDYDLTNGRAVIEGTAAKNLGNACYLVLHIENEDGDVFSGIFIDSAHDYARRVLASSSTSDAMKELAQTLVIYSNKAKAQLGG